MKQKKRNISLQNNTRNWVWWQYGGLRGMYVYASAMDQLSFSPRQTWKKWRNGDVLVTHKLWHEEQSDINRERCSLKQNRLNIWHIRIYPSPVHISVFSLNCRINITWLAAVWFPIHHNCFVSFNFFFLPLWRFRLLPSFFTKSLICQLALKGRGKWLQMELKEQKAQYLQRNHEPTWAFSVPQVTFSLPSLCA